MSNVEKRLLKLEFQVEAQFQQIESLKDLMNINTQRLNQIISNTESLDKILKYVVTPLIALLGAIVGIGVVAA